MKGALLIILFIGCSILPALSFTFLTHEAIVDASWDKYIEPLLKYKFPNATEDELRKIHAFAYGGAILPDIGYYPSGNSEFSNLVHYIRSGDFVIALLEESKTIQEYAFALGVLCHHEADSFGHPLGTNKAVPLLFSRVRKRNGEAATYEQGEDQHMRIEFGFDVLQTAKGNYKPKAYHDFIGFEVSEPVLQRAFLKTYGIHLKDILKNLPAAISNLRYSLNVIIPELTKYAWKFKNSIIIKSNPNASEGSYCYQMKWDDYNKEFAGTAPSIISTKIRVRSKYKPLLGFNPEIPNLEVEELFKKSFDAALAHYTLTLNKLYSVDCTNKNLNLDTGQETEESSYALTDKTYFELLMRLEKNEFAFTNKKLKKNLIDHYDKQNASEILSDKRKERVEHALVKLNSIAAIRRSN